MRRNEVDFYSQPVRNVYTNPQFETGSGNGLVQTNYITAPNMELTGANTVIVRTNLCLNPRGTGTYDPYAGAANQTLTPNVAITGHPAGITTATRVEYTTGANPGVAILNPVVSGTTYTMSAWVYHESVMSTPGSVGFAQAGVAAQPGSPTTAVSSGWQRISWSGYTASGTSQFGYRVSGAGGTGNGSFLITGVLVEIGSVVKPFFDGASADNNLANTAAVAQSASTITSGVSYQGLTWQRASTPVGTGSAIVRQFAPLANLVSGETYTAGVLVANDQAFTQQVTIDWCDLNYQTFTLQPGEVRRIVTTATRATYDSTFRFSDIGFSQSSTEGRSVLFREYIIERGTTSGDYYLGTGDFNYVWSGTANASTSYQRGTAVNTWSSTSGGSNRFADISSTAWTNSGTGKSIRIIPLQANDGTINATYAEITVAGLTVGNTYYVRGINRTTQALGPGYDAGSFRRVMYPGTTPSNIVHTTTPTNTAGVFEYRGSFTATSTSHGIRFYGGASDGGGDVWWDEVSVTDTPVTYYFDGSTPAAGDFTYLWTGTANASTSQQRGAGLPGVTAGNCQVIQSSDWSVSGGKSLRIYPNNQYSSTSAIMLSGSQLERGKTYTAIATRRLTAPLTGALSAYAGAIILVQTGIGTFYSNFISNAAGIGVAKLVFKIVDDGSAWTLRLGHGGSAGSGDVWWDNFMIVEGDYSGDFINPTQNVLAKWDGTAHASTSVGYAPQFLDIAGKPDMDLSTLGVSPTAPTVDPYAARTLYFVYDVYNQGTNYGSYGSYGIANSNGFNLQSSVVGNVGMSVRIDFPNGDFNKSLGGLSASAGMRNQRRHVVGLAFTQGLTSVKYGGDSTPEFTGTLVPGDGWSKGRVTLNADSSGTGLRALVYYAEHDTVTRTAMLRYLGNKYGAAVA